MNERNISWGRQAIAACADVHHQWFLGLQLMVSTRHGPDAVYDWIFRLFRRQHEEKFLSSFEKLGLSGLPHAVACARYHVLSNGIGGVPVEYYEDSPTKAWVRFRYPRWMFDGPVICGMPVEASRGFLNGWYAQNGVSLGNPRLGYVCVSEDIGGWGLCGYFREYDHDLAPEERLRFAPNERPPPFDPAAQPAPPGADWPKERLAKANRNYAVEYIRNALPALIQAVGRDAALSTTHEAARLTGLQRWRHLATMLDCIDGGPEDAAEFLAAMLHGMGDSADIMQDGTKIQHTGLRIVRGLEGQDRDDLLSVWHSLWGGTIQAYRRFMRLSLDPTDEDALIWRIEEL